MATKLGRVVNYHEGPLLKSHMLHLSCGLAISLGQTENISATTMSMSTRLGRLMSYLGILSISQMVLTSRVLARSHDKLKLLYLHYHSVHGQQT